MVEGRRGLGRGLSALLDEGAIEAAADGQNAPAGAREVPIELIHRNPDQPRRTFREEDLEDLAASIRAKGVLQPILVRPISGTPGEFQIVAGERRWRAAQRAGLRALPVLVRELDDLAVLEIAIIENVQRADLNPLEEALGYRALIDRFGHTQDVVAQVVGKSRPHVANLLRLLNLPEGVQVMLADGRLTAGHARALVGSDNAIALAKIIVEKGLSVRETELLVKQGLEVSKPGAKPSSRPVKDTDTQALESDLSDVLGLAVEIKDKNGSGELKIRYASLEQLDDVCRRLTSA